MRVLCFMGSSSYPFLGQELGTTADLIILYKVSIKSKCIIYSMRGRRGETGKAVEVEGNSGIGQSGRR